MTITSRHIEKTSCEQQTKGQKVGSLEPYVMVGVEVTDSGLPLVRRKSGSAHVLIYLGMGYRYLYQNLGVFMVVATIENFMSSLPLPVTLQGLLSLS